MRPVYFATTSNKTIFSLSDPDPVVFCKLPLDIPNAVNNCKVTNGWRALEFDATESQGN